MSSTSTSASESSTYTSPTGGWVGNPAGGGGTTQSTLYLFTFLVVLVILGIIAAGLLFRAFFIKRRFRRRIEEALANGQALPPDALAGLGVVRPAPRKGETKLGPMPVLWEAEMYRDEMKEDGSRRASLLEKDVTRVVEQEVGEDEDDDWRDFTPVSMIHYPTGEPKTYPPPPPPAPPIPQSMPRRQLLRSLFRPDHYDPIAHIRQAELERMRVSEELSTVQTTYEVPDQGSEVVVGVVIAFPSQEGNGSDKWSLSNGGQDEQEVPDVCLGIMEAKIGDKQRR